MRVLLCVLILVARGAHRNGGYSLSCTQMHFCESLTAEKAWFQLVSEISLVYGFDIGPLWCRQRSNFRNCQRQKCVVSVQKCWHLILLWFYEKKSPHFAFLYFLSKHWTIINQKWTKKKDVDFYCCDFEKNLPSLSLCIAFQIGKALLVLMALHSTIVLTSFFLEAHCAAPLFGRVNGLKRVAFYYFVTRAYNEKNGGAYKESLLFCHLQLNLAYVQLFSGIF